MTPYIATAHDNNEQSGHFAYWGDLTREEAIAGRGSHAKITGWWARLWFDRLDASCIADLLANWRIEDNNGKKPGGRKPVIADLVFLTVSMLLALENQPVNATTIGHALETRLDLDARDVFGIGHLYGPTPRDWYHIAYRGLHRIIDLFDGWVAPRQLMLLDERKKIEDDRDPEHTQKMRDRGIEFTSTLIELIIRMQPEEHQRTSLPLSVDQTSMRSGSQRNRWKRDKTTGEEIPKKDKATGIELDRPVLELEAGLYPKEKGAAVKDPSGVSGFVNSAWENVYLADVITDTRENADADHTGQPPLLIRAVTLDTPNKRVGERTLSLLDSIQGRGYTITRLTFDRGYNHLLSGGFHEGLRARGIPNVQDYRDEQKGSTGTVGGAKFAEGDYHCAGTPTELLDATKKYDAAKGGISEDTWKGELNKRWQFILHVKDVKPNGKVRLQCPAIGPSATVSCPLREMHEKAFRGKQEPTQVLKKNLPKRADHTPVCQQDSITIDPNEHLREQQLYRYGTDKWISTYRQDRNTIESVNNQLKADFRLDLSSERRMRGLAANQYVLAFKAAAYNFARIADYARDQLKQAERGERRVIITPIRPDVTIPTATQADDPAVATTPKEKTRRSRDRHGWSNYGRNRKKIEGIYMTLEERRAKKSTNTAETAN